MAQKKAHLTAFIFDLLVAKATPENKLQLSIFILFLSSLEPKGEETVVGHEELWTHHRRSPALSWMTCHHLTHGTGKGGGAQPQLQHPPHPQQACVQMETGRSLCSQQHMLLLPTSTQMPGEMHQK